MVQKQIMKSKSLRIILFNKKHFMKIDFDLLVLKIKRGEATKEAAISALKARSLNTQFDALASIWHVF